MHWWKTGMILVLGLSWGMALAQSDRTIEYWNCEIDLHQGDEGELNFSRKGGGIDGLMTVRRGSQSHRISGAWEGSFITFTRTLSPATSIQRFAGAAMRGDDGVVRMGGRFAASYRGIWSAECHPTTTPGDGLTSTADSEGPSIRLRARGDRSLTAGESLVLRADAKDATGVREVRMLLNGEVVLTCPGTPCNYSFEADREGLFQAQAVAVDTLGNESRSNAVSFEVKGGVSRPAAPVPPSMTRQIRPRRPTSDDQVSFRVNASHDSGIRDVLIYVNNRLVQRCGDGSCSYTGGPYPAGSLNWSAVASSRDGGVNRSEVSRLDIAAAAERADNPIGTDSATAQGRCTIAGRAAGRRADLAYIYSVSLFGPDDLNRYRADTRIADGNFRFDGLPEGRYRLVVDTRADVAINVRPNRTTVNCRGAGPGPVVINFD